MRKGKEKAKKGKTAAHVTKATITANNGLLTEIKIRITNTGKPLTKTEEQRIKTMLVRKISYILGELPYVDYGIENIKLS